MSNLSVFVDESGDFGPVSNHAPYYIITMVFHDQSKSLSKQINHLEYFLEFDKIILYYDNGQNELNQILQMVFYKELSRCEVRCVFPYNYKLFQVADLICTLELLKVKTEVKGLSKSEQLIFHTKRELKKDFIKGLQSKAFDK